MFYFSFGDKIFLNCVFQITFDDSSFQNTNHHIYAFKKCVCNKKIKINSLFQKIWVFFDIGFLHCLQVNMILVMCCATCEGLLILNLCLWIAIDVGIDMVMHDIRNFAYYLHTYDILCDSCMHFEKWLTVRSKGRGGSIMNDKNELEFCCQ